MPAKDSQSKTSKTARVMNLLSKKPDSAPVGEAAESSAPVPPIISSLAPDAEVAGQIKNALENELAAVSGAPATAPAAPAQPAEPAVQAAPAAEPAPAVEPAPVAESAPVAEPAPVVESTPAETAAPRFAEPENPGYINVMQILVEEKAEKYTQMVGMCQCKRCLEDVKAITLNNLPPKYVVLAEGERVPRLTVYETRFSSDITSELLKSCELVADRPHHGRPDP